MAVSPVISNIAGKISEVAHVTRDNPPLSNLLTPGETLSVSVLERLSPNQYRVSLKNVFLTATSDLPLNVGEKLQVKVQSVQPQIVFSIKDAQKQSPDLKINEGLIHWRLNSDSFTQLLGKVNEFLKTLQSGDLPLNISAKETDSLVRLFQDVVFSTQTKMNPLFVKDFVSRLGLMMESDLSKMSWPAAREGGTPLPMDNLKASLLKLSAELSEALRQGSKLAPEATAKLMNLASFTSEALRTIEAKQAVNVIYQQNESGLYLQIPLAVGNYFSQADIFITPDDKNAVSPRKYSSCSIMIFLDLDYLGELSIEASVREGRLRCVIKCERDEIKQLVDAAAGQLRDALSGIGYGVEQIDCLNASSLKSKRAEYIERQLLGSVDLVNYFV